MTIIDRSTDWLIMRKLPHGKDANEVAKTIVRLLKPYRKWIKTITTDNGSEFFRHEYITRKLDIKVYFADPHAPWQRSRLQKDFVNLHLLIDSAIKYNDYYLLMLLILVTFAEVDKSRYI